MTDRLIFRCPLEWRDILPEPLPARDGLPDWLRTMPKDAESPLLDQPVRTVKQCPPFIDAMGAGWLMRLVTDLHVENGSFAWDWDPPPTRFERLQRSPIGLHVSAQVTGSPLASDSEDGSNAFLKFHNFWTIEAPKGVALLFTHPVNRFDLPFRSLTGLVDGDEFTHGLTHFPAEWVDKDFTGTLPKGTPVAQLIPVIRKMDAAFDVLDGKDAEKFEETLDLIADERSGYRKNYRSGDR